MTETATAKAVAKDDVAYSPSTIFYIDDDQHEQRIEKLWIDQTYPGTRAAKSSTIHIPALNKNHTIIVVTRPGSPMEEVFETNQGRLMHRRVRDDKRFVSEVREIARIALKDHYVGDEYSGELDQASLANAVCSVVQSHYRPLDRKITRG